MALTTTYKKQEETAKATQPVQSNSPYSGIGGVSENTANNLGNYQQGYKPNEAVTAAQQNLQQIQAQKPQGYTSKYSAQLDNIMQQIQNPGQFKYEFNGDNLFKNYADLYTQKGKQASMNAMGQAAALTGGYGNSYAQQVGNQAYQQYLLSLYDKGMDLRDRAYGQYQDQLGNQKDIYNMLQGADESDYGRYRDTVSDYYKDEGNAYNRMADERDYDYTQYKDALDYYTGLAQIENADYRNEQERQEAIRQYEQNFAENVRQADIDNAYRSDYFKWQQDTDQRDFDRDVLESDRDKAYDYIKAIIANGQLPSAELLMAAGLSEEDARKMIAMGEQMGLMPTVKVTPPNVTVNIPGLDTKPDTSKVPETYIQGSDAKVRLGNITTPDGKVQISGTPKTMTVADYSRQLEQQIRKEGNPRLNK